MLHVVIRSVCLVGMCLLLVSGEVIITYDEQRTPPYELSTFRTHDIDLEAFIELAIEYELLAKW